MLNPVCLNLELSLLRPLVLKLTDTGSARVERGDAHPHSAANRDHSASTSSPLIIATPTAIPSVDLDLPAVRKHHEMVYSVMRLLLRATIATLAFLVGVLYPNFNGLLALIGTFFSFTVSAIFPCLVYLRLFQGELRIWERALNWAVVVFSGFMVLVGLIWQPLVDMVAPELR